jgi:maltooligosyltrehalose trehalohydrolase
LIALRRTETDFADPWLEHLDVDYDEEKRWITMRRGSFVVACNLGTETVAVPVRGEVVLAWDEPKVGDDATELPGQSVAVLKSVDN